MIATSRYMSPLIPETDLKPVGITRGHPRFRLGYEPRYYAAIAPTWQMLRRGLPKEEFREQYYELLYDLGLARIQQDFEELQGEAPGLVLLCFENLSKAWCHRRLFADWWEEVTGELIPELEEVEQEILW